VVVVILLLLQTLLVLQQLLLLMISVTDLQLLVVFQVLVVTLMVYSQKNQRMYTVFKLLTTQILMVFHLATL